MEVTMDKFGRILIPKKIRKLLGIKPGQSLELIADEKTKTLDLIPKEETEVTLEITDTGIPIFHFAPARRIDIDFANLIRKDREERDLKTWGI